MNFKEILELIDKVAERGIASVEIEQAGTRVRVEGKVAPQLVQLPTVTQAVHAPAAGQPSSAGAAPPSFAESAAAPPLSEQESEAGLHIITAPIVGTFYRSPNPEADPYVAAGDRITKGKVICIIEAMKLMNEIEADVDGVIARVYPQNGQPVEYGEKLFAVRV